MEDRYLFKAKTCRGDWVQGLLASKNGKWYIGNKTGRPLAFEIRPETICQCTGLKDRNGKLIWENDIVKCKVGTAKVIWDESGWKIKWLWRKDLYYWATEDIQSTEVIGNIFDNAELLESEEN